MYKKMLKNTGILSGGTLFSRLLGVFRDVLIAKYFGTSTVLEAYIVAFRLPNILRSLLGEGFSDSVATPVLSEYQNDRPRLLSLGSSLFSVFSVVLLACTLAGILLAKPLVIAMAPGFLKDAAKLSLAVSFTRVTFFYLFFIGLVAVLSSLLYAMKKFAMAAFVPSLFNICLIAGIVFFKKYLHNYILVSSVLVAGLVQFLSLYVYVRMQGVDLPLRLISSFRDKDVLRMFRLFVFRIWASVVYHLNVFIDTIFSSLSWIVGDGALAAIYYSNRIIQFPLALIAISISRVAIVDLSGFHKDKNEDEFKKLLRFSFHNLFFFVIPIACLFVAMSREIIEILYLRGSFDAGSLSMTAPVLFFYSLGLFFFCGVNLLVNTFYSLKDTRTPARTATISLALNAVLSAVLMFPLKIGGVALASSIAALVNFLMLYSALIRKIGPLNWKGIPGELLKLFLAGAAAGLACKAAWIFLPLNKYLRLLCGLSAAGLLFIGLCALLGIGHYHYFKKWITEKK